MTAGRGLKNFRRPLTPPPKGTVEGEARGMFMWLG
jgi:hypothetical protein